ncbi:hypothetical protein BATDEDRAFT_89766 [Batrachochytrium dendrobatidis JAM81]|uniref:Pre-mRNA-splicing factor SPF27 n=2 Tax=Batrachochytrium dendrobatidis TaxID=109871 RepID=F4P5S2_BATDJ|nr:uncharacterized protein BATDEDRAFT_89766 [Batrachochytrium dendrobatidis JAM81]EGF79472.1 hypothetical protein BATDEDRAFT_89766 [Batrachochytrium dendrobatidis JAM81]OAJ42831.1 hypothetical protein BDEG_26237 [Batrachochytrium dendrobatidis JEL423]|eukprot:XP_006680167.1 hypothetical protein BATDEDRAFT_89766 [Batrachochytrium dendrobatidis JAM81]
MDDFDSVLVDCLPYIDPDYDPAIVDALVNAELQSSRIPRPTLDLIKLNETELFKDHPALAGLLDQVAAGIKMQAIDTTRFRLEAPTDENEWDAAVNNARAQLEHQSQRLVNLELVTRMGANAWRIHNYQLEAAIKNMKSQLELCNERIEAVNKIRKADQMQAQPTLRALSERWTELIQSTIAVRMENQRLDAQIKQLQSQAPSK